MDDIDIAGLDKAEVLCALYNRARTQGMGILHYTPEDMTREEAQSILDTGQTYFDYVKGRVLKVDLGGDNLFPGLYDRDNGAGAVQSVIVKIQTPSLTEGKKP